MLRLKKGFYSQLKNELSLVLNFSRTFLFYLKQKVSVVSFAFESVKNAIVASFLFKRGRYTRPILHFGMISFLGIGVLVAPIIAETNPLLPDNNSNNTQGPNEELLSITDINVFETKISPKPRDRVIIYKVQKGETVSVIAEKFGVSTDTIKWTNDMANDSLAVGQEIKIPPVTGMVHKVVRGDTVFTIAKKYDTDAQKIVNFPFNDFANSETFSLVEGQLLVVPDGIKPKAIRRRPTPAFIAREQISGGSAGFIWPASGNITQNPVWYHMAVDIANKAAPEVMASKTGKVLSAQCDRGGYGCHVIIDHDDGTQTLYGHLQKFHTSVGASVGQGEVIGQMGSTGRSTGTHLHFEVRKNGTPVNPLNFLK